MFSTDSDSSDIDEAGPWPAFVDLLSATTLLFLILFAAIAVPAIARARNAQEQLSARESTLREVQEVLLASGDTSVRLERVGDYLRVTITGEATFEQNQSDLEYLRSEGREILQSFGSSLKGHPELMEKIDQIQVVGHTSSEGPAELNWRLSASRATTVALFLIDIVGLSPCKVTALGRGRYYPLDPSSARQGTVDQRNRRIELEIRPVIVGDSVQIRRGSDCVEDAGG